MDGWLHGWMDGLSEGAKGILDAEKRSFLTEKSCYQRRAAVPSRRGQVELQWIMESSSKIITLQIQ